MSKCCNTCKHKYSGKDKYFLCDWLGKRQDWSDWYLDKDYCSKWEEKKELLRQLKPKQ